MFGERRFHKTGTRERHPQDGPSTLDHVALLPLNPLPWKLLGNPKPTIKVTFLISTELLSRGFCGPNLLGNIWGSTKAALFIRHLRGEALEGVSLKQHMGHAQNTRICRL